MLKRINWKGILIGLAWAISLSGLVVLMSFIEKEKEGQKCTEVRVLMPGQYNLISKQEIDRILWSTAGNLAGQDLRTINMQALEDALQLNPFVKNARVYADMNGIIWVRVLQREPLLRIINSKNQDFYIDEDGFKIPTSPNYTPRILVANGLITEDLESRVRKIKTPLGKALFNVAVFIQKDTLWNHQIEQIYVNQDAEIELVPRIGDQQIVLGTADSLEKKFNNLLIFYKEAMPRVGWNTYKSINLKYANQIVCKKNRSVADTALKPASADSVKAIPQPVKN